MILTLWGSLDQKEGRELEQKIDDVPMIFAMRVKVTTFYGQFMFTYSTIIYIRSHIQITALIFILQIPTGLSLSTKGASAILINPPVTEELQLKAWYFQLKLFLK